MKRPWLLPLLALLALVVVVENVIYFSQGEEPGPSVGDDHATDEDDSYEDDDDERGAAALPPVAAERVGSYLDALPAASFERNPFAMRAAGRGGQATAGVQRQSAARPVLDGTLYGDTRRVAWLDGVVVREGDRFGRYEVARIGSDAVVLRSGESEIHLEVDRARTRSGTGPAATAALPSAELPEDGRP